MVVQSARLQSVPFHLFCFLKIYLAACLMPQRASLQKPETWETPSLGGAPVCPGQWVVMWSGSVTTALLWSLESCVMAAGLEASQPGQFVAGADSSTG